MSETKIKIIRAQSGFFSLGKSSTRLSAFLGYWRPGTMALAVFLCIWGLAASGTEPVAEAIEDNEPRVLGVSTEIRGPQKPSLSPELVAPIIGSKVTADAFLVADMDSGTVLSERNAGARKSVASLTKLMTGLVAYERLGLSATLEIAKKDTVSVSPSLRLVPGDLVAAQDIFNAMLVGSENDAAVALSNHTASATGQSFVDLMNERALDLGMKETHFANPTGFEAINHYSTASDLLKLVLETQKLSAFTALGRKTRYDFSGSLGTAYHAAATNKLVAAHPDVEAVKTGYTTAAGEAMISKITRNGHPLLIIVLGSTSREADTLLLADEAFGSVRWQQR